MFVLFLLFKLTNGENLGLYLLEGIFFSITMVIQWEGYQPRREEQVDTILL